MDACIHSPPNSLPIQANFRLYFKQSFLFCVCVLVAQLCLTLCELTNCSPSGSSVLDGFSRQECWRRNTFPSPGNLPNPGIELQPLTLQADSLPFEPPKKPYSTCIFLLNLHLSLSRTFPLRSLPDSCPPYIHRIGYVLSLHSGLHYYYSINYYNTNTLLILPISKGTRLLSCLL